ncbi:hypothetical protein [uncultured Alistipes sp.]|uniref:hypothetical protein n=1 Tax=uncultured Alistipes sp. TaxID=538949 RepID=UPI002624F588|nr:hypothetical protein [uncultured Alistipes sp.]
MKNYALLLLAAVLCFGCSDGSDDRVGNKTHSVLMHHFVTAYVRCTTFSLSYSDDALHIGPGKDATAIVTPDLNGEQDEEYLRLAQRNGDTGYDRRYYTEFLPLRYCFADEIASVEAVCTNRALDAEHPAGTSLRDVMRIRFLSCAPYVRSGYAGEVEWTEYDLLLSETRTEDFALMDTGFTLRFAQKQEWSRESFLLDITLRTVGGAEYVVHAEFRPYA